MTYHQLTERDQKTVAIRVRIFAYHDKIASRYTAGDFSWRFQVSDPTV